MLDQNSSSDPTLTDTRRSLYSTIRDAARRILADETGPLCSAVASKLESLQITIKIIISKSKDREQKKEQETYSSTFFSGGKSNALSSVTSSGKTRLELVRKRSGCATRLTSHQRAKMVTTRAPAGPPRTSISA